MYRFGYIYSPKPSAPHFNASILYSCYNIISAAIIVSLKLEIINAKID